MKNDTSSLYSSYFCLVKVKEFLQCFYIEQPPQYQKTVDSLDLLVCLGIPLYSLFQ